MLLVISTILNIYIGQKGYPDISAIVIANKIFQDCPLTFSTMPVNSQKRLLGIRETKFTCGNSFASSPE